MEEKLSSCPLKKKKLFFRIGLVSLILTFMIGATGNFAFAKEVTIKVDGTDTTVRGGIFQNVQEILENNGIVLNDEESASTNPQTKIVGVSTAPASEKNTGNLQVDGETIPYETDVNTVAELLSENNIKLGDIDRVEPSKTTALSEINEIKIIRVEIEVESTRKEIPYTSETKENPELKIGKIQVIQHGKNGVAYVIKHIVYENNVEVSRETISEEVVTAPKSEIVEVAANQPEGLTPVVVSPPTTPAVEKTPPVEETTAVEATPAAVELPEVVETPAIEETPIVDETPAAPLAETADAIPLGGTKKILNFTAYTATGNATASGVMPEANHTIAAWNGLPFGTKVYVPSLGTTFIVEDRGGAVTEGIIDIYMNTYNQCIQFGRQNLEAYISY